MTRVFDKVHTAAKLDVAYVNQVESDIVKYAQATEAPREKLNHEAKDWAEEGREVRQQYKEAVEFSLENIHYDAPRPGHPGSIDFTNNNQVAEAWRDAIESDEELGHEIVEDVQEYEQEVAPAKAALRNSVRTNWKAKRDAYINSVKAVIQELQTPATAQVETEEPETLVTDAEAAKMKRVADKIHIAAKLDVAQANQVLGDLVKYHEATEPARQQLKREIQGWKAEGK